MICEKCRTLNPNENTKCVRCGGDLEPPQEGLKPITKSIYSYGNAIPPQFTTEHNKPKKEMSKQARSIIMLAGLAITVLIMFLNRAVAVEYWQNNLQRWFQSPDSLALQQISDTTATEASLPTKVFPKKKYSHSNKKTEDGDIDYYKIMKEKGISESGDTIIFQNNSQGISAEQLKRKVHRESGAYFGNDNKLMVLVPAQSFLMGTNNGAEIEGPAYETRVSAFFMDAHEVTNTEFKRFLNLSGYKPTGSLSHLNDARFNDPKQPVVDISYEDARRYADWVGKRLPTEEEWECAAKGGKQLVYPSGNSITPTNAAFKIDAPKQVGSYKANAFGIYDLGGNVAEIIDATLKPYPGSYNTKNKFAKTRVCRGGSWASSTEELRCTSRKAIPDNIGSGTTGFRCVISAE